MDKNNIEQLKKLAKIFQSDKVITTDEIQQVLKGILQIMNSFKKDNETLTTETKQKVSDLFDQITAENDKIVADLKTDNKTTKKDILSQVQTKIDEINSLRDEFMLLKPLDGEDSDPEEIIAEVLKRIQLPEYEKVILDDGDKIIQKINSANEKINASQIIGLPKFTREIVREITNAGAHGGGYETPIKDSNGRLLAKDASGAWIVPASSGGSGTVTSVASADGSITVVNPTTTVDLAVVSAPKLTTARTINGVSFDGSINITVTAAAGTLSGNTLAATVVTSSLTAVGNLVTGSIGTGFVIKGVTMTLGSDATGDMYYRNSSGVLTRIAPGSQNDVLTLGASSVPGWATPSGGGATVALDNLSGVAINAALVLATSDAFALGSATKMWADLFLADGAVINFNNGDVTLTHSTDTLTLGGGNLAIGANNITMTGSLGATGARLTKGWFTDLQVTNAIAGSVTGNAATATALQNARTIGGVSFDGTANITVSTATGGFTVSGGTLAIGANNLTMTGALAATGARVSSAFFTVLESTTIELGAASDTTLARVSAGVISVEGVTLVDVSSAQTLSTKTLTAPKFASGGFIADANGNELIIFTTTASAVNEITFANAATGGNPTFSATGGDSVIDIAITPKGANGAIVIAGPIKLTGSPGTDGTMSGNSTRSFNAGYTTAVGDLVILDSSATWQKTDANTASIYAGMLGIAMEIATSGNPCLVALPGSFVHATAFPTMTIGAVMYMSETAGVITATQPTTTDAAIRVIGVAVHADKIFFYPSQDYITHT